MVMCKGKYMKNEIRLIKPDIKYKESFLKILNDCDELGESEAWIYMHPSEHHLPKTNFNVYVDKLLQYEFEAPPFFVRGITYWAVQGEEIVGRVGFRLELNETLKKLGGHIGYITAPKFRGQGIATQMLAMTLNTKEAKEIGKLLLTCNEDNLASEKTIIKNGGVYLDTIKLEDGSLKKRFWITVL